MGKKENAFSEALDSWKSEYDYQIDYDALKITKTEDAAASSSDAA